MTVSNLDEEKIDLKVDYFLPFFGLSSELGPIKEWELEIEKNLLSVDQSSLQTSARGIFAIGDICDYPGKLKLILTGFKPMFSVQDAIEEVKSAYISKRLKNSKKFFTVSWMKKLKIS